MSARAEWTEEDWTRFLSLPFHRNNTYQGGFPERSKGSDCKSDGIAFAGSNPAPPTHGLHGGRQKKVAVRSDWSREKK